MKQKTMDTYILSVVFTMAIIIYYLRDLNSSIFFILINIFMFLLTRDLKIVVPLVLLTTYLYTDCMFDYKEGAKNKKRKKKRREQYVNGGLYVRETMEGRKKGGTNTQLDAIKVSTDR